MITHYASFQYLCIVSSPGIQGRTERMDVYRHQLWTQLWRLNAVKNISSILCQHFHSKVDKVRSMSTECIHQPQAQRIIFSGIQPTGVLHLGNYFGAVKHWVNLQNSSINDNVIVSIVDLHSITLPQDPTQLNGNVLTMAAALLACGIDPDRSLLFQQSRLAEHAQLHWVLSCLASLARLRHLPHFKEKSATLKEIPLGICVYPVLQAADILLYHATHVPIGEDQRPHIEFTADLARAFNNRFGQTFKIPLPLVTDNATARLRSLRQPNKKMSKSEADVKGRIEITDSPDIIKEKLKKAVTDCIGEVYYDPENRLGVSNLMAIHSALSGTSFEDIRREQSAKNTGEYKLVVAEVVIEYLKPIRKKMLELLENKEHLVAILELGAEGARKRASKTWRDVQGKVGFLLPGMSN